MDDHAWQQLLNKIYSVETECWSFLSFSRTFSDYDSGSSFSKFSNANKNEKSIRLNLPYIAGINGDPLLSFQMMNKVFELLKTPKKLLL